jgi:hypothetical protein
LPARGAVCRYRTPQRIGVAPRAFTR